MQLGQMACLLGSRVIDLGFMPVLYTPPGILLDSDWTPRTPSGVRSDSLDSPKTEAISTQKEEKLTWSLSSPSSARAQTLSDC
jgi:hypothetical protein